MFFYYAREGVVVTRGKRMSFALSRGAGLQTAGLPKKHVATVRRRRGYPPAKSWQSGGGSRKGFFTNYFETIGYVIRWEAFFSANSLKKVGEHPPFGRVSFWHERLDTIPRLREEGVNGELLRSSILRLKRFFKGALKRVATAEIERRACGILPQGRITKTNRSNGSASPPIAA
jgi:hypothetical protein